MHRPWPGCGGARPNDPRRVLPGEGRAQRLELLLQLPVPAPRAPSRDHRAVRVLPRGRRHRRRGRRPAGRARRARLVARRDRAPVCRRSAHPVTGRWPLTWALRHRPGLAGRIIDGMQMDLEQDRYPDFEGLRLYCHRVAGVVVSWQPASSARTRRAGLRRATRPGVPAHQHRPRRRKTRKGQSTCRSKTSSAGVPAHEILAARPAIVSSR